MKRLLPLIASVAILSLILGCSLSMDDWVPREEDLGKDDIATIESEYGSVSFQFKEGVLYVTDRIQEDYIAKVEHDSIIYFDSNIPSEWRPYVGMKMAASISQTLPYGLNHKVLSVQDVGGLLKVVATRVSTDEVYEHLKYCFESPVTMIDPEDMTDEELADCGYEWDIDPNTGDSVLIDWNDYEVAKGIRPAEVKRRSLSAYKARRQTRGENEKYDEEGELDKSGVANDVVLDQFWDTRDLEGLSEGKSVMKKAVKKMFDELDNAAKDAMKKSKLGVDMELYCGMGVKIVSHKISHVEEDKDRNYELKWVEEWNDWILKFETGVSAKGSVSKQDMTTGFGSSHHMLKQAKDMTTQLGKDFQKKITMKAKTSTRFGTAKVRIPLCFIGPVPVAIIIGAELRPTIEINGSIGFSLTYTSDRIRTIHKVENGVVTDDTLTVSSGHIESAEYYGSASIKVGLGIRLYAGIEVGGTAGVQVGANLGGYVQGDASVTLIPLYGDNVQFGNIEANLCFTVDFYVDVTLFVAPLGIEVWSHEALKFAQINLITMYLSAGPRVSSVTSAAYLMPGTTDSWRLHSIMHMDEFDVGNDVILKLHKYYPGMRLYFGPIKDDVPWVYMTPIKDYSDIDTYNFPMTEWPTVKGNTRYGFVWNGDIKKIAEDNDLAPISEVHMVPVFYSYESGKEPAGSAQFLDVYDGISDEDMIVMENKESYQSVGDPEVYVVDVKQLPSIDKGMVKNGNSLGDGTYTSDVWETPKHIWQERIYVLVKVNGGSRLSRWYMDLQLYDPWKRRISNGHAVVPIDRKISGYVTFVFSVYTDWIVDGNDFNTQEVVDEKGNQVKPRLYVKVKPYWKDPNAENAYIYSDREISSKRFPIQMNFTGNKDLESKLKSKDYKEKLGDIIERDLN